MKNYTLTWRPRIRVGLCAKKLCRCRFDFLSPVYPFSICIGLTKKDAMRLNPIFAFMYVCTLSDAPNSLRLSSCGRLVARSATYQGV